MAQLFSPFADYSWLQLQNKEAEKDSVLFCRKPRFDEIFPLRSPASAAVKFGVFEPQGNAEDAG